MIKFDAPHALHLPGPACRTRQWTLFTTLLLAGTLALPPAGCVGVKAPPQLPQAIADDRAPQRQPGAPSPEERLLHELLNQYRVASRLEPVALSVSLSKVARLHAGDLASHALGDSCSIHSWSATGPWQSCCYDLRRPDPKCMWNKPRELTRYQAVGFEIAYRYSAGVRPSKALEAWKASPVHNAVILNLGMWSGQEWKAVGVGIDGEYATVWWGRDADPAGYWP